MKLFALLAVLFLLLFVFPSVRNPGVDCLAGCAQGLGQPFAYSISHSGGAIIPGQPAQKDDFYAEYLAADIAYWLLAAALLAWIARRWGAKKRWVGVLVVVLGAYLFFIAGSAIARTLPFYPR